MKTSTLLAAFAVLSLVPVRADAQQMTLNIQNGLVTMDAQNVSIRQILAEWARVGGSKIVNGDPLRAENIPVSSHPCSAYLAHPAESLPNGTV